jgi:hypothetical protein
VARGVADFIAGSAISGIGFEIHAAVRAHDLSGSAFILALSPGAHFIRIQRAACGFNFIRMQRAACGFIRCSTYANLTRIAQIARRAVALRIASKPFQAVAQSALASGNQRNGDEPAAEQ